MEKIFKYERYYNNNFTDDSKANVNYVNITISNYEDIKHIFLYDDDNKYIIDIHTITSILSIADINTKEEAIEIYNEICNLLSDLKKNEELRDEEYKNALIRSMC
jgi:hypothetical protein